MRILNDYQVSGYMHGQVEALHGEILALHGHLEALHGDVKAMHIVIHSDMQKHMIA